MGGETSGKGGMGQDYLIAPDPAAPRLTRGNAYAQVGENVKSHLAEIREAVLGDGSI